MKFNGKKFAEIRKQKNIKQRDVAKILRCAQPSVQAWESGKTLPSRISIEVIADAIGCKVSDIIDDYMPLPPAGKYAKLADDPMLPMLLDKWLMLGVVEKAKVIEYAGEIYTTMDAKKDSQHLA